MKHLPFIILLIILALYLGIKTLPENGWGGWCGGECDAQTLLSIKHWVKDGFIQNKFLFIPIGYSKIVEYLDNPAMRQHARGTTTGQLIGNRLYYTHYPPGYLIPYAIMAKLGVDPMTERPYFRLLSLLFSFSALILLYYFFIFLTNNNLISFFAIAYYAISTMFLDYADSLANQPIDELLRNAILVLSLLAIFQYNNKIYKNYNYYIWILYFILSISSYDSTFFVFVWLIGLGIITKLQSLTPTLSLKKGEGVKEILKSLPYKQWLFFASAPILAFGLQMFQNYWYFGNWHEVWLDILGASMAKAYTSNIFKHLSNIFYPFYLLTGFKLFLASLLVLISAFSLWKLKASYFKNLWPFLIILFSAGSIYPFIFISAGRFSYQGRQMAPFVALLMGIAAASIIRAFQNKEKNNIFYFSLLIIAIVVLWSGQIYRTIQYVYDWPNNKAGDNVIQVAGSLKSLTFGDSAVFYTGNNISIGPLSDYYFDMPVFYFKNKENLIKDFLWLKKNSQYPFEALIMADSQAAINSLYQLSNEMKINGLGNVVFIQNEYLFKIMP